VQHCKIVAAKPAKDFHSYKKHDTELIKFECDLNTPTPHKEKQPSDLTEFQQYKAVSSNTQPFCPVRYSVLSRKYHH
jgi:hypothetical protein